METIRRIKRGVFPTHPGCSVSDIGVAFALVLHAKERTVRVPSSLVLTHSEIRSLPYKAELWDRHPQTVFPVPPGGP